MVLSEKRNPIARAAFGDISAASIPNEKRVANSSDCPMKPFVGTILFPYNVCAATLAKSSLLFCPAMVAQRSRGQGLIGSAVRFRNVAGSNEPSSLRVAREITYPALLASRHAPGVSGA